MIAIDNDVRQALHYATGTRKVRFRYELLDNNEVKKAVALDVISCSVAYDEGSECKRTGRITLKQNEGINWVSDLIRPYMSVWVNGQWHDFSLGIYVPSTPQLSTDGKTSIAEVDLYDKMIYLKEDCITERLYIPAGTLYTAAVQELFAPYPVILDDCDTKIPIDREFEIGERKIDIINKLLEEINFRKAEVNNEGVYVCKRFYMPTVDTISYTYRADELSVIKGDSSTIQDFYNVPNVFFCVVSNSELPEDLQSMYVNDNSGNKLSTVSRGRRIVKRLDPPDVVASQKELDEYVQKQAFEMSQVFEESTFKTALMPIHESNETLEIHAKDLEGVYIETAWSMELSVSGEMEHTVRRLNALY